MDRPKPRPSIVLYTDAAAIDDDVKAAMIEAGYLPVRVSDVDAVRIMPVTHGIDAGDMSAITAAALEAVAKHGTQDVPARFGWALTKALLEQRAKSSK